MRKIIRKLVASTMALALIISSLPMAALADTVAGVDVFTTPQVEGGIGFVAALKDDGTVWTWGKNTWGQLGNGTTTSSNTPAQLSAFGGKKIKKISAKRNTVAAIDEDNKVWLWGLNTGILPLSPTTISSPVQVTALASEEIIDISVAQTHLLALNSNGAVWAMGDNSAGALGTGNTNSYTQPVLVTALSDKTITSVSAYGHSMALASDGTVWAWGPNMYGQLGLPGGSAVSTPTQVSGITGATKIEASSNRSYAIVGGSLYAWGLNGSGSLGIGTYASTNHTPTVVSLPGGETPVSVKGNYDHTLALAASGNLYAWGANWAGMYGNGTTNDQPSPLFIRDLTANADEFATIGAGWENGFAYSSSGTLQAWGSDSDGQIGNGAATGDVLSPYTIFSDWTLTAVDSFPPRYPTDVVASNITWNSATLSWSPTEDDVGVVGYNVYRGGTLIGYTETTTYNLTNLTSLTTYGFVVTAKDASGKESGNSNAVSITTLEAPDTTAPTAPAKVFATGITSSGVTLHWTGSSDNKAVTGYEVLNEDDVVATSSSQAAVISGLEPDTNYDLSVVAMDAAGNRSEPTDLSLKTAKAKRVGVPPVSVSPDNKVITVNFNEPIFSAKTGSTPAIRNAALKAAILVSKDAASESPSWSPLTSKDVMAVKGKSLVITLAAPLSSSANAIKIPGSSIQDAKKNILTDELITDLFGADLSAPKIVDSSIAPDKDIITLVFDEPILAVAADKKIPLEAVQFSNDAESDEPDFGVLNIGDKISIKGNTMVLALKTVTSMQYNAVKIAPNTITDAAGNKSQDPTVQMVIHDLSAPVVKSTIVGPDNKTITINFDKPVEPVSTAKNAAKSAITISKNGGSYLPLGSSDKVTIVKNSIVITLSSVLAGNDSIKIAPQSIESARGISAAPYTSDILVLDKSGPSVSNISVASSGKIITIVLNESAKVALANKAPIASAIQIKQGDGEFAALVATDKATLKANTLVITLTTAINPAVVNSIKIAELAMTDSLGNKSAEIIVNTNAANSDQVAPRLVD